MENKKYYVYEYIRLDTNEPFYIGKGSGRRWRATKRANEYFNNICKNIPVAVSILHDNLEEEEALQIESWYIWQLRDVQGYWLVNLDDGGIGRSRPMKKRPTFGEKWSGLNSHRSKQVLLIKDGKIVRRFVRQRDLYDKEWRKDFPTPNYKKYLWECLKFGKTFHGYQIIYEKDFKK